MNHTNLHIHTLNIRRAIQHISQPRWWKSRLLTWELFRWVGSRYSLLPHRNCYHVDSLDCYQRRLRRVETVSPSIILKSIKSSSTCLRSTWVEVNTFSHCIFRWGGSGYPLSPHPNIYLVNSFDVHQSRIKCTTRVYRNKTYDKYENSSSSKHEIRLGGSRDVLLGTDLDEVTADIRCHLVKEFWRSPKTQWMQLQRINRQYTWQVHTLSSSTLWKSTLWKSGLIILDPLRCGDSGYPLSPHRHSYHANSVYVYKCLVKGCKQINM